MNSIAHYHYFYLEQTPVGDIRLPLHPHIRLEIPNSLPQAPCFFFRHNLEHNPQFELKFQPNVNHRQPMLLILMSTFRRYWYN